MPLAGPEGPLPLPGKESRPRSGGIGFPRPFGAALSWLQGPPGTRLLFSGHTQVLMVPGTLGALTTGSFLIPPTHLFQTEVTAWPSQASSALLLSELTGTQAAPQNGTEPAAFLCQAGPLLPWLQCCQGWCLRTVSCALKNPSSSRASVTATECLQRPFLPVSNPCSSPSGGISSDFQQKTVEGQAPRCEGLGRPALRLILRNTSMSPPGTPAPSPLGNCKLFPHQNSALAACRPKDAPLGLPAKGSETCSPHSLLC